MDILAKSKPFSPESLCASSLHKQQSLQHLLRVQSSFGGSLERLTLPNNWHPEKKTVHVCGLYRGRFGFIKAVLSDTLQGFHAYSSFSFARRQYMFPTVTRTSMHRGFIPAIGCWNPPSPWCSVLSIGGRAAHQSPSRLSDSHTAALCRCCQQIDATCPCEISDLSSNMGSSSLNST